jgi:hypothetical protein
MADTPGVGHKPEVVILSANPDPGKIVGDD